jgi:hypothetical protein
MNFKIKETLARLLVREPVTISKILMNEARNLL